MVLDKQQVVIPFAQGVDQKTDEKHLQHVKLASLENGQFDKIGTINKRNGYTELSDDLEGGITEISRICGLMTKQNELIINAHQRNTTESAPDVTDGWKMFSLDDNDDEWREIGRHLPTDTNLHTICRPHETWIAPDMAECNGYYCFVWADDLTMGAAYGLPYTAAGDVYCSIVDASTGALVVDQHNWGVTNARVPKVLRVGDSFHVWCTDNVGNLKLAIINTATITTIGAFVNKQNNVAAAQLWDACRVNVGPGMQPCSVVAYRESTVGSEIRTVSYNEAGVLQTFGNRAGTQAINAVCCARLYDHFTGDYQVGIFWQDNITNNVLGYLYDEDMTAHWGGNRTIYTLAGGEEVKAITAIEDPSYFVTTPAASSVRVYIEIANPSRPPWANYIIQSTYRFDDVGGAVVGSFRNCCLATKAFRHHNKAFVFVTNAQVAQGSLFLKENINNVAGYNLVHTPLKLLPSAGLNHSVDVLSPGLPQVVYSNIPITGFFRFATVRRERLGYNAITSTIYPAKSICMVEFATGNHTHLSNSQVDRNTVVSGGLVGEFDGRFIETGFHLYPELDPAPVNQYSITGAAGVLAAGTYYWVITYEWTDREGQVHKSAPSDVIEVAIALNDGVRFLTPFLHHGHIDKLPDVVICAYRLGTDGLYHKESVTIPNDVTDDFVPNVAANIQGAVTTDPDLLECEILYTEGGTMANIGPPASNVIAARRDRVFIVPDEDRTLVQCSKLKRHGQGLAFTDDPAFQVRIPAGGDILALGVMDDKVIVFKENEIHAFAGAGPNDQGIGNFSEPFIVAQDVGLKSELYRYARNSVEVTDKGITFHSDKGFYILTRSLQPQYIGAPVDDLKAYSVLKTLSMPTKNQIRLMTTHGIMYVFDTLTGQWSEFDYPNNPVDAVMWQDSFVFYTGAWNICQESGAYSDGGASIDLAVETAWIKLNGLQGYQRTFWVTLLGEYKSAHTLNINIYYDYDDAAPYQTITKVVDAAMGADVPYQFRFRPKKSRCEAIKFRIYDSNIASGECYSLSALQLEIGILKGLYRNKPTKTLGG